MTRNSHRIDFSSHYQSLYNNSRDIILFIRKRDGQILEANGAAVDAYQYLHEELLAMTLYDLRSPDTHRDVAPQMAKAESSGLLFETTHRRKRGESFAVEVSSQGTLIEGETVLVSIIREITKRKLTEAYREMGREVLQILNEPGDLQVSIPRVLATLKRRTGFDAVGVRLQDGDDFPYFVQEGFSKDFLLTENTLIGPATDGGVCRDKEGNISLECTCGLVISGKTDPANPLFTPGGSCWTNDSFPLLEIPPGEDPRFHPRNQCIHQGYACIALVPIRNRGRIVGLIQFNDRRKGRFTIETVELLEGIASHIGEALIRKQMEKERELLVVELQKALSEVKKLSGLLPICASCKMIRDDKGYWNQIESYIRDHSEAEFSHGICPDCVKKLYPDLYDKKINKQRILILSTRTC